ncbi:hypothetical protein VTL71DRAFT_11874 [Oculimacula yallundae]|uniref:CFEM domain-containing protein n=1 Tax=Oculimacula yallundae TaxID=86028 RepID=A0ABR4CSY3_9HELO
MKLYLLIIASALASLTNAQGEGVPSCATPCVNQFTTGGGNAIAGCNRLDAACICSNKSFLSDIACCLVDKCSVADQQKATNYALAFCQANQVTGLPTAVSCASTITSTGMPSSTNNAAATITSGSATSSVAANGASTTGSGTTSAPANAAPTNAAGVGAGILGGLAAVVALL